MLLHSTITCHECKAQTLLWTVEFPPVGVICVVCGQVYKFTKSDAEGKAHFQIVPHRL